MENITLYDVLDNSYGNDPNGFAKGGFEFDSNISDHNNYLYYNKEKKELLHTISGTKSIGDIGTDFYLGLGLLKNTNRYKQADDRLAKARDKYKPEKVTVVGSSLGGAIASKIGKRTDKIITYNKPSLINEIIIPNETSYRTKTDMISILNPSKNTTTLPNKKYKLPYLPTTRAVLADAHDSHKLKHLKDTNIFI